MKNNIVLFNPLSDNNKGEENVQNIKNILDGNLEFRNILDVSSYEVFFSSLTEDDRLIIAGGDGTLNRFINETEGLEINREIYYYATGNGNDFIRDICSDKETKIVEITPYIHNLPFVSVDDGKKVRMLNGIGFGIDGYCCEVGDREKKKNPGKKINYTSIAIKGLLFHFKPVTAKIKVDGKEYTFKKVWIAPTMNGRFYGGGMMAAPKQNRIGEERSLSLVLLHGKGRIKTLMDFPSIFTGEHVNKSTCTILKGKKIEVEFSSPSPAQIDGETILNVKKYVAEVD